ncbi:hypothetical protein NE237_016489 [Protea cynaroides]|uniref:Plantacyanin n=1 Tax=Protea cynaroides TaxID=273540 RepID=A0A9Q0K6U2_9MAGN|nr:hypothetical protein NE237_016489 [Protea cynaroides]
MAQGRGSAARTMIVGITLLGLMLHCEIVNAANHNHTVGDSDGWTFYMKNWPLGKKFRTNDTLIFSYNHYMHDVAVVDKNGYYNCQTTPTGAKVYTSGNDHIKLVKGHNYFICSYSEHCELFKMRMDVHAV